MPIPLGIILIKFAGIPDSKQKKETA